VAEEIRPRGFLKERGMIYCQKSKYNSVRITADSVTELAQTFMRFQEHYESPKFRGQIFTVGQIKQWYSQNYGADLYHAEWVGFNFPSSVLIPFKQGLFDPLTEFEERFLSFFKYRHDNFYIIGANDDSTLRHELSHALYNYKPEYAKAVKTLCNKHKKDLLKTAKYIIDKGYHPDVLEDEIQAYITDNNDKFVIENTPKKVIDAFNSVYAKFSEEQ
jgi:hypothetical protein